jgi:hypothetical protein
MILVSDTIPAKTIIRRKHFQRAQRDDTRASDQENQNSPHGFSPPEDILTQR